MCNANASEVGGRFSSLKFLLFHFKKQRSDMDVGNNGFPLQTPMNEVPFLTNFSWDVLRCPRYGGKCPPLRATSVVLPISCGLLTVSLPVMTCSVNRWGMISFCATTDCLLSIGFIFCERGTINASALTLRACLKWQRSTNTSVSLHLT